MPEIRHSTLILTIQAIAREIKELQQTINDGDAVPDVFQMLEDLLDAAQIWNRLMTRQLNPC